MMLVLVVLLLFYRCFFLVVVFSLLYSLKNKRSLFYTNFCFLSFFFFLSAGTLVDHGVFCAIHMNECLSKKRTKQAHAPNIWLMIQRFNQLNLWSVTNIVVNALVEDRIHVYEWTIEFIVALVDLNNYHAALAVFSGLTCSTMSRLKLTVAGVSSKHKEWLEELGVLFNLDGKNKNMRKRMKQLNSTTTCIPHIGIFLSDLTMLDEMDSITKSNGHINFRKCRRISGIIEKLLMYQDSSYALHRIDSLYTHMKLLGGTLKRTESFALSKKWEPNK